MSFCTVCGQKIEAGFQFCTSCGAPLAATAQPVAPVPSPQAYAPVKKRSGLALVLILLGVLAMLAVICIGGVVYVGYKVKEKVTSVAQSVAHPSPGPGENKASSPGANNDDDNKDVSAILGNLGSMLGGGADDGDPVESISAKDPVIPCSATPFPAQAKAQIPLQAATTATTAWGIKTVMWKAA